MKKYQILIPPPKKSKGVTGKIVIKYHDKEKEICLNYGQKTCDFEVEDKYSWIYSGNPKPEDSFEVFVAYSYKEITQTKNLVPELI